MLLLTVISKLNFPQQRWLFSSFSNQDLFSKHKASLLCLDLHVPVFSRNFQHQIIFAQAAIMYILSFLTIR